MIISLVLGGLGNQMFQYALGRQLASRQGVALKLETLGFRLPKYRAHPYLLDRLDIHAGRAHPSDYLRVALGGGLRSVTREPAAGFDARVLALTHATVLVGYWQSEKYFPDVAASLREEFTLKAAPGEQTREIARRIAACESVAVHVRRTDYVADPRNVALFAEHSPDYYRAAMQLVAERVRAPHFFLFSDDPAWARANIRSDHPLTCVDHNDAARGHEDLMLMRACRHNVIANSTFSWWGAWLNDHPGKVVVAPRRWFKSDGGKERDLLPADWLTL